MLTMGLQMLPRGFSTTTPPRLKNISEVPIRHGWTLRIYVTLQKLLGSSILSYRVLCCRRDTEKQEQHFKLKQQLYKLMRHALKQYGVRNELERLQVIEDSTNLCSGLP